MKNSNDTIGNRNRDLPACSAVPQPTAPRACNNTVTTTTKVTTTVTTTTNTTVTTVA